MSDRRRAGFVCACLLIGVAGPFLTGCSRKPASSQDAGESERTVAANASERRTQLSTGPWEWQVVSFEFADSYTRKSNNPTLAPITLKAKDSQTKVAVVRVRAKPIREYTPDEASAMKKTYVGQVALAFAQPFGANRFLATRCFLLGHIARMGHADRQTVLTPCQVLVAETSGAKEAEGIVFDDKDTLAPHVEVAYTKDEPIQATLAFSNVPVDSDLVLFFHPIPAGAEMGKEMGAARLTLTNQALATVEYGDRDEIKKWFSDASLDFSRGDSSHTIAPSK